MYKGDYHYHLTETDAEGYRAAFDDGYSFEGIVNEEYRSLSDLIGDENILREDVEASLRSFLAYHEIDIP